MTGNRAVTHSHGSTVTVLNEILERIDRAIIEVGLAQSNRVKRPLERDLADALAPFYGKQGRAVADALAPFSGQLDSNADQVASESARMVRSTDPPFLRPSRTRAKEQDQGLITTLSRAMVLAVDDGDLALLDVITEGHIPAYNGGANTAFRNLDFDLFWLPADPAAIAYAELVGADRVTEIQDTTKKTLNRLITTAVTDGRGADLLAKDIRQTFKKWQGTQDQRDSLSSKARSVRIAKFEIGDAYEAGHQDAAEVVAATGVAMEQSWLSAGDKKVRPEHRENDDQGWIEFGTDYQSGNRRPPTDPGCRCAQLFRRV